MTNSTLNSHYYRDLSDLPLVLRVRDVQVVLGVSRRTRRRAGPPGGKRQYRSHR